MGKRIKIDTHMAIQISDGEHEYLTLLESYRDHCVFLSCTQLGE